MLAGRCSRWPHLSAASMLKMCSVPLLLLAQSSAGSTPGPLKARELMAAGVVPLRKVKAFDACTKSPTRCSQRIYVVRHAVDLSRMLCRLRDNLIIAISYDDAIAFEAQVPAVKLS